MKNAAVIFDLDGCLVDSESLVLAAIVDEMKSLGVEDATPTEIRDRFMGSTLHIIAQYVGQRLKGPAPVAFADNVHTRLMKLYARDLRTIDDMVAFADRLARQGVKTAIATGGSVDRMNQTLRYSGIASLFEGRAFSAEQVVQGKPAPDLFLFTALQLGVKPEHCVVIEDSPLGVTGAVAAGMRAIGFTGGEHLDGIRQQHAARLEQAGAELVFADPAAIADAVLHRKAG